MLRQGTYSFSMCLYLDHDAPSTLFCKGPHRLNVVMLQGLTFFLSYAILAAVLGMLQFGYNTGVINAPEVVSVMKDMQVTLFVE